jgi:hypothetical protein
MGAGIDQPCSTRDKSCHPLADGVNRVVAAVNVAGQRNVAAPLALGGVFARVVIVIGRWDTGQPHALGLVAGAHGEQLGKRLGRVILAGRNAGIVLALEIDELARGPRLRGGLFRLVKHWHRR